MKQKTRVIFSTLMIFTVLFTLFAANVQAAITLTANATGKIDGYDYEYWKDSGTGTMTLNGGGTFSCSWSNINNILFRTGKKLGSTKTYQDYGKIVIDYTCNYQPDGNSFMAVYGWTEDPLVEYYIIDSYGTWKPPGNNIPLKGTVTVDGRTYEIYQNTRRTGPSISIGTSFQQYWSVCTTKRTSGTISVSDHFKAWESMGMKMGKMYEVSMLVEGYQSSGKADMTKMDLIIGNSQSPTSTTKPTPTSTTTKPTPTNTPIPFTVEDLNNDGAINMSDIMLCATAFNSVRGDGKYVPVYDLNNDGAVNMSDIMIIAAKFNTIVSQPTPTPILEPTPIPTPQGVVKLMPLGDSITDGLTVPGGYRIKLWKSITSNGQTVDFLGSMSNGPAELGDKNHEGHSGWTISQIDTNINTWMDTYKPQIVLLHIGTNDMYQNPTGAPDRLSTLIDKICAKLPTGGKVYVSNIIPFPMSAANVTAYNAKIPGIVQQKASSGKPVYFVEMYNALTTADLADGVHPNATGYNKMADVWYNAIKADLAK